MPEFNFDQLKELVGKERFTLSEVIPILIDNQEKLLLTLNDLQHVIAILFQFETDELGHLIFTTFKGVITLKELGEAGQIIWDYKHPTHILDLKEAIEQAVEQIKEMPWYKEDKIDT